MIKYFIYAAAAVACFCQFINCTESKAYQPTWESLDSRPLPSWYDDVKIGIFIHWGVFSVPSFKSEWIWNYWREERYDDVLDFIKKNYPPNFTYQDFAKDFKAEFYDPDQWASLFEASGARYVVMTTKHHEGYTLWPSKTSFGWNSVDVGPKRDLVADLATAIRKRPGMHFGVYHSLFEWYNPLWLQDQSTNFTTNLFAKGKAIPELYELVNNYQPEVIWSDGAPADDTYWGSKEFLAWLYNESPVRDTVVVNDRWGTNTSCQHGGFYNCADRFSPGVLQPHKWENALTIDRLSWGYRRNAFLEEYMSIQDLLEQLVKTVSCGGNVLINVGPTKEGIIDPIYEERLRELGSWLNGNGEAIYGSRPWSAQNDTINENVWYVKKDPFVYGIVLGWPERDTVALGDIKTQESTKVQLLTYTEDLEFSKVNDDIVLIAMPNRTQVLSDWAFVLKFSGLLNM